jgi:hypothetical protein
MRTFSVDRSCETLKRNPVSSIGDPSSEESEAPAAGRQGDRWSEEEESNLSRGFDVHVGGPIDTGRVCKIRLLIFL